MLQKWLGLGPNRARAAGSMWPHLKPRVSVNAQCTLDVLNGYNVPSTVHIELRLQRDSFNTESIGQDETEACIPGGSQEFSSGPHCLTFSRFDFLLDCKTVPKKLERRGHNHIGLKRTGVSQWLAQNTLQWRPCDQEAAGQARPQSTGGLAQNHLDL